MGATTQNQNSGQIPQKGGLKRTNETSSGETLNQEEIFEILSNQRRRRVLKYLQQREPNSDLRTLSTLIAAIENDINPDQVSSTQRTRTYTALRQSHLPKMDDIGIIDFDSDSGEVQLRKPASDIEKYLNAVFKDEKNWIRYYSGVGIAGLLMSAGCILDFAFFSAVPDAGAGVIISIGIIFASLFQLSYSKAFNQIDLGAV